jgi:hypothetical protein
MSDTLSLAPDDAVRGLLNLARKEIAGGENQLRMAADHIAAAEDKGASQREIAAAVGKSPAWVNRLLQWRRSGYQDESAFGRQSRASRSRSRVQSAKRRSGRGKAIVKAMLIDSSRRRLIKLLGMLGSDHENERANAAEKVEEHRLTLKLSWEELIVPSFDAQFDVEDDPDDDPDDEPESAKSWQ